MAGSEISTSNPRSDLDLSKIVVAPKAPALTVTSAINMAVDIVDAVTDEEREKEDRAVERRNSQITFVSSAEPLSEVTFSPVDMNKRLEREEAAAAAR